MLRYAVATHAHVNGILIMHPAAGTDCPATCSTLPDHYAAAR